MKALFAALLLALPLSAQVADTSATLVQISPASGPAVAPGEAIQFTASPIDSTGINRVIAVRWRSQDTLIATVDSISGLARGVREGFVRIFARAGTAEGSVNLQVMIPEVTVVVPAGLLDSLRIELTRSRSFIRGAETQLNKTLNLLGRVNEAARDPILADTTATFDFMRVGFLLNHEGGWGDLVWDSITITEPGDSVLACAYGFVGDSTAVLGSDDAVPVWLSDTSPNCPGPSGMEWWQWLSAFLASGLGGAALVKYLRDKKRVQTA
jgi:hypothetical protein